MKFIYLLLIAIVFFSCGKNKVRIANLSDTKVGNYAKSELQKYLGKIYTDAKFAASSDEDATIQLLLSEQAKALDLSEIPMQKESFRIIQKNKKIYIVSPDERGLLNATYALLEKLGAGFYISGDVVPQKKWSGFEGWEMNDSPLTGDRFLFNWHNFLSGCTGWNLEDWKMWIDQANKMRYNGIMVHAYGNNPMFSFEYLGEKKQTGYLNNTASGRDWGNQHINDVQRMVGGDIFSAPVYGAKVSMASEENKEKEATKLMQQVFQYAEESGTKIIFALDFDTWMSNPRNIIEKLPGEAVFELIGGHLTPNPDHPEGYKYFKHVLKSLLEMYPQIDQLSVWHRRPGTTASLGSIWMSFPYEKFPQDWKEEYKEKLKEHPEIEDNLMASGTFAYGKLIAAIQRARDEIKPELEITSGSWRFEYIPYADAMYPTDVPLLPLDWEVVFNTPKAQKILADAGKNREMYPIIWAHHDDHRYIGRPYTPWENLNDKLNKTNSKGFGIIHWTTRPLDLYFANSGKQVWANSENESIKKTVKDYVKTNFGENKKLVEYYYKWLTEGPMFGRETSDHFVDLGIQKHRYGLESWEAMEEKTKERLALLNEIPLVSENSFLQYQKAMEKFYVSFFNNQQLFIKAYELAQNEKYDEAKNSIQKANPDETIQKYVDAIKFIGFTSGEKALVFSMNTRWKADFINLRQRLGLEPVRYKFTPTQHDPLAQGAGHYSYYIDTDKNWWRCLWKHELKDEIFLDSENQTALKIQNNFIFPLSSIHGQNLADGNYEIQLNTIHSAKKEDVKINLLNTEKNKSTPINNIQFDENKIVFKTSVSGQVKLKISSQNTVLQVESIAISKI